MNEYCTKVNILQWDILVTTCYELGIKIQKQPDINLCTHYTYVKYSDGVGITTWTTMEDTYDDEVSFQEFLTKLRKIKQWTPKKGEMVEVSNNGEKWYVLEYITNRNDAHVCWSNSGLPHTSYYRYIRPLTPTITRAEAEAKLKTLGVNVKITD
jgi:hypothetical protein